MVKIAVEIKNVYRASQDVQIIHVYSASTLYAFVALLMLVMLPSFYCGHL